MKTSHSRKSINRSPVRLGFILIPLLLAYLALSPVAQAGPQSRPSPTPSPAPATQPFQASVSGVFTIDADTGLLPITTVPAGKRLIIEHISVFGFMQTGQKIIQATIGVALQNVNNGDNLYHYLTLSAQGSTADGSLDFYSASEQVRLYADPATQVFAYAQRDSYSGSESSARFAISGYLVDVP